MLLTGRGNEAGGASIIPLHIVPNPKIAITKSAYTDNGVRVGRCACDAEKDVATVTRSGAAVISAIVCAAGTIILPAIHRRIYALCVACPPTDIDPLGISTVAIVCTCLAASIGRSGVDVIREASITRVLFVTRFPAIATDTTFVVLHAVDLHVKGHIGKLRRSGLQRQNAPTEAKQDGNDAVLHNLTV